MYSHRDKEQFATAIVLISTMPFAVLAVVAIIKAFQAAF